MRYISTRNKSLSVSASEAICKGIAEDGGLFVPQEFPKLNNKDILSLQYKSYEERAAYIMSLYLDDFNYDELLTYTTAAYSKFDGDPSPLVNIDEGIYVLELWHGPTFAFKDMALTLLPYLLTAAKKKIKDNTKTMILVATSGDTGKAALEGFKDVDGTDILIFYPNEGVSLMQQLQMSTQKGDNVYVASINGNFDDAQNAVKEVFADKNIQKQLKEDNYTLSSANSINWGRLLPQIVYYISAYCDLLSEDKIQVDDKVNFCVPCGNFGNILAGYYAMQMGLPINKLICASNINNILTDFFTTGVYNINRDFYKTMSPSMDILVSSNLERLLFEILGRKDEEIIRLMADLKEKGSYTIDKHILQNNFSCFEAGFATEEDTLDTIYNNFDVYNYIYDPHTAVAAYVNNEYLLTGDTSPTIIVSTANPYKFAPDVYKAISEGSITDEFTAAKRIRLLTGMEMPQEIENLKDMIIRFEDVIEKEDIPQKVIDYTMRQNK